MYPRGFLAYTCREDLHLNEDFIFVEPQFLEDVIKIRFFPVDYRYVPYAAHSQGNYT